MASAINDLKEFINTAQRNRNYSTNTAIAKRTALRLFETELNDQEKESLETFKANLNKISNEVFNRNKDKMSVGSLQVYKSRIAGLITDYEKYGSDPSKFASWVAKSKSISSKKITQVGKATNNKNKEPIEPTSVPNIEITNTKTSRFELPLRTDVKAIIIVPSDITKEEVSKIKKYVDFLNEIAQ